MKRCASVTIQALQAASSCSRLAPASYNILLNSHYNPDTCCAATRNSANNGHWLTSRQHTHAFSTSEGAGPGPGAGQREAVEKMIDMMVRTPALQQMMMAALPPAMRKPEVLQSLFSNPASRAQIVDMIAKQGMAIPPEVFQRMGNVDNMEQSLVQAERMGLSPQEMFQRLLQYPVLMQKFQDPRVVRAFLDIAHNPDRLEHYRDQPDIIEVYFKAKEVLLPKQEKPFSQPPPELPEASPSASGPDFTLPTPPDTRSTSHQAASPSDQGAPALPAGAAGMLGIGGDEVLQRLLANPSAVAALSKPKVQEALREAAGSKWKMLKYMFDPEIRAAVQELEKVMDSSKPPSKR